MFQRTRSGAGSYPEQRLVIEPCKFHSLSNQSFRNLFVNGKQLTAPKLILTTPQIPEQDNQA